MPDRQSPPATAQAIPDWLKVACASWRWPTPLFAWIDRVDTAGSLVEIGAASVQHKPIFLAFSNRSIADYFYFIEQLADIAVIARSAPAAWKLFTHWRAAE